MAEDQKEEQTDKAEEEKESQMTIGTIMFYLTTYLLSLQKVLNL